jgi:hypothetical protein
MSNEGIQDFSVNNEGATAFRGRLCVPKKETSKEQISREAHCG